MLTDLARRRSVKRRNLLVAVAASVAVLAGGGAAAGVLASGPGARQPAVHWTMDSGHSTATDVSAVVRYRPQSWGTEIHIWASGVPSGTRCQLWVTDSTGRRMMAGSWDVPPSSEDTWYLGSAAFTAESISRFQITSHGKTLVTLNS
jgi:hypothetical protein